MAGDISVLFVLPTSLCAEFDGFVEWKWNNIAIGNTLTNEILLNNVAMTFNMRYESGSLGQNKVHFGNDRSEPFGKKQSMLQISINHRHVWTIGVLT